MAEDAGDVIALVIIHALESLTYRDVISLCFTGKNIRNAIINQQPPVWQRLCKQEFGYR